MRLESLKLDYRLHRSRWWLAGVGLVAVAALLLVSLAGYTAVQLTRFARADARRTTFVHAAGQALAPGVNVRAVDLAGTLGRLRYTETRAAPGAPGQFHRGGGAWEIYLRGEAGAPPRRVRLEVRGDRITQVLAGGAAVGAAALEGEVLTSVSDQPGEEYRPVRLADVPPVLLDAVLAAEDHRFFEHGGLDLHGLVRAAWTNFRAGRVRQGGSTITQQLVKNRLLTSERTYLRKINEAWLAAVVTWRYPKTQILESYLNEMYLGQRGGLAVRGVGAAARAYFHKEVHQLTLDEAALLAGMIRAPNSYSPALHPERARERRDVVLARMRELKMIDARDEAAARARPLRVEASTSGAQTAGYFTDYVREEVEQDLDDAAVGRGLHVYTTLDLPLQRFAETAVSHGLARLEARWPRLRRAAGGRPLQAALVALDPATGEVRALVGGRDYRASQFNRAVMARRQPGSAFKPFVYLAALTPRGGPPAFTAASFVDDAPLTIAVGRETWTPRNYEDRYEGRVSVRTALEHSLNAATVRVAETVGLDTVLETAHAAGITSPLDAVPAVALGAFEVTPLELARAYAPFANGGVRPRGPAAIRSAIDADGDALALSTEEPLAVMSPAEAYLMTSLLRGVVDEGTASAARALGLRGVAAGKTGTTNDGRDAWFVGYTPALLALVWVGFDSGEAHGLSGAQAALPIWADFMRQAADAYPSADFVTPAGVSIVAIDATNGKTANRFCPVVITETFLTGTEPPVCDEHGGAGDQMRDWWRRFRDWFRR